MNILYIFLFFPALTFAAQPCAHCINTANIFLGHAGIIKSEVLDKHKDPKDRANTLCNLAGSFGLLAIFQIGNEQCYLQAAIFLGNPKFSQYITRKASGEAITGEQVCEEEKLCAGYIWNDLTKYITSMDETSWPRWKFLLARNNDIYAILRGPGTPSKKTEVHILSAVSGYKEVSRYITALHETNVWWDFAIAPNNDIFCICKAGCPRISNLPNSKMTDLHILSAQDKYQKFIYRSATGHHETNEHYKFQVSKNRDLFIIKMLGASKTTEVHILSAAKNYMEFSLQTPTALHVTGNAYQLFIHPKTDDLVVIKKLYTGTNTTEVHVLPRANNYQTFKYHSGTALHETSWRDFMFAGVAENWDVYGINMVDTEEEKTEVYVLHSVL